MPFAGALLEWFDLAAVVVAVVELVASPGELPAVPLVELPADGAAFAVFEAAGWLVGATIRS